METRKIKLVSFALAMFVALAVAVCLVFKQNDNKVYAAEVVISEWSQKDGALLGDTLDVPQSVKLKVDENTVIDAESGLIYFPDGNAKTLGPKLLDMVGKYTLQYQAKHNGKTVYGEESFIVKESNYYISNYTFSGAEYKTADQLKYGVQLGVKKADGIEVSLAKGDYFRFNQPINIKEVAAQNGGFVDVSLAYPVMDTSLVSNDPSYDAAGDQNGYWGTRLGSYFTIKLIDCYDETNFVEFYIWSNQDKRNKIKETYVGAGASGQNFTGLVEGTGADATIELGGKTYSTRYNERYKVNPWGVYGYGNTYSLYSRTSTKDSFRLNVNTNEVYFGSTLVTDLDHTQIYPDNAFKGFTTGEVYVQYSFENNWTSEPMELYIKSILGLQGEQLKKGVVDDDKMPEVNIDIEYTDVGEKAITVLYNQEFTLPTATVYDVNGKNEYKLAVYYDYYTDNPKSVYMKDGKFTPTKKGVVYTAVYLAEDGFGNRNVDANGKCIDVINIIPVSGKAFTYGEDKVDSLSACVGNELPAIEVASLNTNVKVKVFAVEPNGNRVEITDTFNGTGYTLNPAFIGEYTIEYQFIDNVYTDIFSYKVTSVESGNVIFPEKMALPSVFIKDAVYDLEPYYAQIATANGLEKKQAKILVSVDDGEFVEITDTRKFKVVGSSSLSFKAEYNGKQSAAQLCRITDVNFACDAAVNEGEKVYENYFIGFDEVMTTDTYMEYTFNDAQSASLHYATPLVFNTFKLEFEIPESAKNLNEVNIILKEIRGIDSGYVISYVNNFTADKLFYTIKSLDGTIKYLSATVKSNFVGVHTIAISNNKITLGEGSVVTVPGVEAKNIDFSISIPNPNAAFSLKILSVGGVAFNNYVYEKDLQIVYQSPIGAPEIGEEYVIPTFNVSSVFYPVSLANLTYSLKDNAGVALLDKNGNKVENISGDVTGIVVVPYEVKTYYLTVKYTGMRVAKCNYVLAVIDNTAPVVTFKDGSTDKTEVKVKVGAKHQIKEYTVADDVTASENLLVKVIIVDASSAVVAWDVDTSYTFTKAGTYKVIVFAQDENNNASRSYYKVVVA